MHFTIAAVALEIAVAVSDDARGRLVAVANVRADAPIVVKARR